MNESENRQLTKAFATYFGSWYLPIGLNIAALLTVLCLIVLTKHPKLFASSTRVWFSAMMTMDVLILIINGYDLMFELYFTEIYHNVLFKIFGKYVCVIRLSIINFLFWNSLWLQSGLSLERLASVICPFKTRAFLTANLARFAVIIISTFTLTVSFLANANVRPVINKEQYSNNFRNCFQKTEDMTVYYVDLFLRVFAFFLMLVSSGILAIFLRYSRIKRSQLLNSISRSQRKVQTTSYNRESRASFLLLIMNITTLLTNPLFIIFELLDGAKSENQPGGILTGDNDLTDFLALLFNLIMYINNQTNCIFFVAFGARFRSHMANLICCRNNFNKNSSSVAGTSKFTSDTLPSRHESHNRYRSQKSNGLLAMLKHEEECSKISVPIEEISMGEYFHENGEIAFKNSET